MPWLLYWKMPLLVIAALMWLPPSPSSAIPPSVVEPELAVPATPIVLLRTRAFSVPTVAPTAVARTSIATPIEPFSELLRMSTVWLPTEVVTRRLPPAAAPGCAFAPRLSKVLPSANNGPPMTASIVDPELLTALIQSARAPLMIDDFSVKFSVVPAFCDAIKILLLPFAVLLKPNVL